MATLCNTDLEIREALNHLIDLNSVRLQCLAISEIDLANHAGDVLRQSISNQSELWLAWREMLRNDNRPEAYYVGCLIVDAIDSL